jgi:hypothetical protein
MNTFVRNTIVLYIRYRKIERQKETSGRLDSCMRGCSSVSLAAPKAGGRLVEYVGWFIEGICRC